MYLKNDQTGNSWSAYINGAPENMYEFTQDNYS